MKAMLLLAGCLCLVAFVACGGDDDDAGGDGGDSSEALFDPGEGDALAHAALPVAEDLPGDGWELVATDDFDDEAGDDEFFELAEQEESCQEINDLAALGDIMGSTDAEELTAARAKAEFQRASADLLPASVEVEVNVAETVAEVQGGWGIARSVLQSEDTSNCLSALMAAAMAAEDSSGLLDIELEAVDPPAGAPSNGVALAFAMTVKAGPITLEALMGLYQWPYSNALVQVVIFGALDDLPPAEFADIIGAVDDSVIAAAGG